MKTAKTMRSKLSDDALREIDRFCKAGHAVIIPLTVRDILDEQMAQKLA